MTLAVTALENFQSVRPEFLFTFFNSCVYAVAIDQVID